MATRLCYFVQHSGFGDVSACFKGLYCRWPSIDVTLLLRASD
jgi:hypothetical protein